MKMFFLINNLLILSRIIHRKGYKNFQMDLQSEESF